MRQTRKQGSEKEGVRVSPPPALVTRPPSSISFPPQPFPFPGGRHRRWPGCARGPVCDSQAERIMWMAAFPARSRRGDSPGSQRAPKDPEHPWCPTAAAPAAISRKAQENRSGEREEEEGVEKGRTTLRSLPGTSDLLLWGPYLVPRFQQHGVSAAGGAELKCWNPRTSRHPRRQAGLPSGQVLLLYRPADPSPRHRGGGRGKWR